MKEHMNQKPMNQQPVNQEQINQEAVKAIFIESQALLEGHFRLTSGKHSRQYVQCAQVLKYPWHTETLVGALKAKLTGTCDLVVGPAMGGVIVAYEMGRQLGVPALFTEREDGKMKLRRGFTIQPGQRVLVVEDVITTGGSVQEAIECVQEAGGIVEAAAVLVDRSGGSHVLQVPVTSLLQLTIETFDPDNCPLCVDSQPVKPGSRLLP
ncbi:orotate phosphoribosyltransferase [Anoxynatronum sibiricum]|uniref:Orotate phosphoribosyltransferase n=1 Tax=Anoxynatronum sibiricum TaxID=210623 RepID=A0ABU9VU66_9CLOT